MFIYFQERLSSLGQQVSWRIFQLTLAMVHWLPIAGRISSTQMIQKSELKKMYKLNFFLKISVKRVKLIHKCEVSRQTVVTGLLSSMWEIIPQNYDHTIISDFI